MFTIHAVSLYLITTSTTRSFKRTVTCLLTPAIYRTYIRLPLPSDTVSKRISKDARFDRYFTHVVGAIDGTHFKAKIPKDQQEAYRNRKGTMTWNVLASVDMDMNVAYILPGWEGSATDHRLWSIARMKDLHLPEGTVLLGDAGFPLCDACLNPYRATRYHLWEWEVQGNKSVLAIKKAAHETHQYQVLLLQAKECTGIVQPSTFVTSKRSRTYLWRHPSTI